MLGVTKINLSMQKGYLLFHIYHNLIWNIFHFHFTGESDESSLVVSLEINSVMYQGVLFAQPGSLGSSKFSSSDNSAKAALTGKDQSSNKEVHKKI